MHPETRSSRLTIGAFAESDAETLFGYRTHPDVARFQSWVPESVAAVRSFLTENAERRWATTDTWVQLAIRMSDTMAVVGDLAVHLSGAVGPQFEIGFTIAPDWQRRGLGAEAVAALLGRLFEHDGAHRVTASVDPRNLASLALLRRVGMRREAHFRKSLFWKGEWVDDVAFGLLREEWRPGHDG